MLVPVYDILNCGPNHRFSANGRLVHNSGKINFQNLPSRGGSNALKNSICAPKGYILIDCDSSQIEARILAWLARQDDLTEGFRKKEDVYKRMAAKIYGVPETEINKEQRFIGKSTTLGAGYGMSGKRFKEQIGGMGMFIEESEATRIISIYRQTYECIPELWSLAGDAIYAISRGQTLKFPRDAVEVVHGGVRLPSGLLIRYENLRRVKSENGKTDWIYDQGKKPVRLHGPKMVENICQGLARCVIAEQMLMISERYRVCLTVHDAVLSLVREEEKEEAMDYITTRMRYVPFWAEGLPLDCEAGSGVSYGEC